MNVNAEFLAIFYQWEGWNDVEESNIDSWTFSECDLEHQILSESEISGTYTFSPIEESSDVNGVTEINIGTYLLWSDQDGRAIERRGQLLNW